VKQVKLTGKDKYFTRKQQLDISDDIGRGLTITELAKKYNISVKIMGNVYGKRLKDLMKKTKPISNKVYLFMGQTCYDKTEEELFEGIPEYNYETLSEDEKQIFNKI
jgi:hypothetical protein